MVWFLLIRDLSFLFTLVAACQLVAHPVGYSNAAPSPRPSISLLSGLNTDTLTSLHVFAILCSYATRQ